MKYNAVGFRSAFFFHAGLYGTVDIPPQPGYHRIGISPCRYKRLKFLLRKTHLKGTHCFQGTDRTPVAEGEFSDFSLLTEVSVHAVLFNRNTKHLTGTAAIDVFAFLKHTKTPLFSRKPRKNPRLNGRKVCYDKFSVLLRHKGSTDKL